MSIKKVFFATIISSTFLVTAQAADLEAADRSGFTQLCMTAVSGNRAAMHTKIKNSGYSRTYVVTKVRCNDQSLPEFVQRYGKNSLAMLAMLKGGSSHSSEKKLALNSRGSF